MTIQERFEKFYNPNLGAIIILARAIRGQKYGKQPIVNAFNKLVSIEEYAKNEKAALLEWLWSVSSVFEKGNLAK